MWLRVDDLDLWGFISCYSRHDFLEFAAVTFCWDAILVIRWSRLLVQNNDHRNFRRFLSFHGACCMFKVLQIQFVKEWY